MRLRPSLLPTLCSLPCPVPFHHSLPSLLSTAHFPGVLFAPVLSLVSMWRWSCHRGRAGVTSFPKAGSCTQLRQRGLEMLPGAKSIPVEPGASPWIIPVETGASPWICQEQGASLWSLEHPMDHPCGAWRSHGSSLWSLENPSGAQDAPGRDHPRVISPTKGRCFTLVPDAHVEMIPASWKGSPSPWLGRAGLRVSQHEIVPQ